MVPGDRAHARRGVVVWRDVRLAQELPPFFVRTLPDPREARTCGAAAAGTGQSGGKVARGIAPLSKLPMVSLPCLIPIFKLLKIAPFYN